MMSVPARVVHKRRATITDLPLYHSGHLLKKHTKEKDFKQYYGELRGATLFLYKDDTQDTYTEKLDLEQLKSTDLDSPNQKKTPLIFTLTLQTQEVQLKMDSADTGEEWRVYILTVIKKEIPRELNLLPGQKMQLQEVLVQERRRNPPTQRPALPPRPPFMASASRSKPDDSSLEIPGSCRCFFTVSRLEAEQMLEANPEYGGIIIRPSTLANNYALTLRQQTQSGPVTKNYRVTSTKSGFVIELDEPVTVSSLNEVLKYFLEKTEYRLQPYTVSQPYDTRIDVSPPPKCISVSSPAPKTVPQAEVAPMLRSKTKDEIVPTPAKPVEGEYVLPDEHNLKLGELDGELREVLKLRREAIDPVTDEEKVTAEKSKSGTAQWTTC